jgi:hypothetical protein
MRSSERQVTNGEVSEFYGLRTELQEGIIMDFKEVHHRPSSDLQNAYRTNARRANRGRRCSS